MDNIVSHYGIHWDSGGVAWLHQGRGGTNAWGLKEKSPFTVRLPSRQIHCNHMIQLSASVPNDHHWQIFAQMLDDALVRAFLPTPKADGGVYYVENLGAEQALILAVLAKMSSPIYSIVNPMWTLTPTAILQQMQNTNVQPFVITDVAAKDSETVSQLAKAAVYAPRKLVFVGANDVVLNPSVKRLKTEITKYSTPDLVSLPWETLGATTCKLYMRKEFNANPEGSYVDVNKKAGTRHAT
jgi:hypothetical protein